MAVDAVSARRVGGVHIALLRGINVGGKNRLPMKDLAEMFHEAGCGDVRTYIQSGNVVFTAEPALARRVPGLVERAITDGLGLAVPVTTRTITELEEVAAGNPFLTKDTDTKALHVAFLLDRPSEDKIATLDPERSPPDAFVVCGREIYLRCPNGIGRSKLTTQYFDSKLGTTSTVRNWRTVSKLLDIARDG